MTRARTALRLSFPVADETDAEAIARVRSAAADRLTRDHGYGPWSLGATGDDVLRAIRASRVLVARIGDAIVGTLRLATMKPWAIDVAYFTPARRPLYLSDMAVTPEWQGQGIGRALLAEAVTLAEAWPGDAIRLDAYDAPAGAGGFYAACGWIERGRVTYRNAPLIYFEHLPPAVMKR